jgi:hypothetical protein
MQMTRRTANIADHRLHAAAHREDDAAERRYYEYHAGRGARLLYSLLSLFNGR